MPGTSSIPGDQHRRINAHSYYPSIFLQVQSNRAVHRPRCAGDEKPTDTLAADICRVRPLRSPREHALADTKALATVDVYCVTGLLDHRRNRPGTLEISLVIPAIVQVAGCQSKTVSPSIVQRTLRMPVPLSPTTSNTIFISTPSIVCAVTCC